MRRAGVGDRQRATPLALDYVEHFGVGHATEAVDELMPGDGIAAFRQHVGMGLADDRLAVDQHPIAVENHQVE